MESAILNTAVVFKENENFKGLDPRNEKRTNEYGCIISNI
jgi:hypothetical protein